MKKFYNNIECEVVAELPGNEVAIRFITGLFYEYDSEFGSSAEPIESTLVVQKKQLTDKPITKDDIVLERENMLKEIEQIKINRIQEANIQIRQERDKLEKELKILREERAEILKSSDVFETIRKYRAGDYYTDREKYMEDVCCNVDYLQFPNLWVFYTGKMGYDTYDSGVFSAWTESRAREIAEKKSSDFIKADIELIGIYNKQAEEEICSSFNAG